MTLALLAFRYYSHFLSESELAKLLQESRFSSLFANFLQSMPDSAANQDYFQKLVSHVREGDALAAEELVRLYEADLRIIARSKLFDPRLRQQFDSMDICQSIFGNFFARAYLGQFDIDTPEQLKKLLAKMVRNKVIDYSRRSRARGGQVQHKNFSESEGFSFVDSQPSIGGVIAAKELAEEFRKRLTGEECIVFERRLEGWSWEEIGKSENVGPDAVRKRYTRAIDRVAQELGIDRS